MRKQLLKPDNARLTVLWTIGKEKEIARQDEINLKIPQVPKKKQKRGPVILQFYPDKKDRVKLYSEPVSLTDREYLFLKCLAEKPGETVDGNYIYTELYTEYGQESPYELYNIKYRILKILQKQFGKKRVPSTIILNIPREGFLLNLYPWQVEIK